MELSGLVAVVTGGAQGIGAAIASGLAAAGARVAVFDVSPPGGDDSFAADATSEASAGAGPDAVAERPGPVGHVVIDVASEASAGAGPDAVAARLGAVAERPGPVGHFVVDVTSEASAEAGPDAVAARPGAVAERPGPVGHFVVDVTSEEEVAAGLDAVAERFGAIGLLVNNAAVTASDPSWSGRPVLDLPVAQWRRVLDVNLTGAFICAQQAARRMAAAGRGGLIVNIGSVQGARPTRGSADYATSKAGLAMLTHCLAGELAPHGIRVNAVAPGPIAPPGSQPGPSGTLTGAWGTPDDVAAAVVYLAGPGGRFVNSHILMLDDGASVLPRHPPPRS